MKKIILFASAVLALSACNPEKLDMNKAKTCVEGLISASDKGNFDQVKQYYSTSFTESEAAEQKMEKLKMLKNALGDVTSMQLVDSLNEAKPGEGAEIVLTYKVMHTKITSIEKYSVIKEHNDYKITSQDIKSAN